MGNKKTPLIQKLRENGGTLYVFPSATEDIGLNLQSTTTGVAMSHFALLNIPQIDVSTCLKETKHNVKYYNGNDALAMSLQNYAMNMETLITNDPDYNYQKLNTISEKVFWKWARHIGIFNPNDLSNSSTGNDNIYMDTRYNADGSTYTQDNTLIKCFGSIDAGNQLSTEFGMFNETYINIPTSWGAGPVFMKHSDDPNFKLGQTYPSKSTEYLEGRGDSNEYYSYTNNQDFPFFDNISEGNTQGQYLVSNTLDGFEILKDLHQIQISSQNCFNDDTILFDSYDDINIDTLNQLNIDQQFEFNTILLYYSVYDQDDLVKTAYATNLFGVIFLDGTRMVDSNSALFNIPTLLKRKSTTSQFGNSYSFRVNLKTMSVYDNTDAIIQDNTTMSAIDAVEFADAISNMNRAIDIMNSNLTTTLAIQDQYAAIINYYDNFDTDMKDISTMINAYVRGTHSSVLNTSILYAKEIRTSEYDSFFNENNIVIKTHKLEKDLNGNTVYNEPELIVTEGDVTIPVIHNTSLWTKSSYVIVDPGTSGNDKNILDPNQLSDLIVNTCNIALDNAFSAKPNEGFVIKVKIDSGENETRLSKNELYIDNNSPIFNQESDSNLRCLLDSSNNIDYTKIIPYLIAEIKRINAILNYTNIGDLRNLDLDELYKEIFVVDQPNGQENDLLNNDN